MTAKRHFYAAYNSYGIRMSFNEFNCPMVHVFDTKRERDEWVDEHWDIHQEMDSKDAKKWIKRNPEFVEIH